MVYFTLLCAGVFKAFYEPDSGP